MDQVDKAILRAVQSRLPIDAQPFAKLGQELGLSEEEVLDRLAALKISGVIRRIGGNFNSRDLGFASTLCAAQVPEEKLESFVAAVNAFHGVTHNYRRSHEYNVWFTFIAQSMEQIEENLARIAAQTGVSEICSLPARKMFKIKVDFPV
ncbi:MAG: Lrp/AsnC family transcriptional regulator [Desulfarculus sp.]|nr:MAG: Lrp/AsnC family transcriptional regulator [Desulfarculus sp.]